VLFALLLDSARSFFLDSFSPFFRKWVRSTLPSSSRKRDPAGLRADPSGKEIGEKIDSLLFAYHIY